MPVPYTLYLFICITYSQCLSSAGMGWYIILSLVKKGPPCTGTYCNARTLYRYIFSPEKCSQMLFFITSCRFYMPLINCVKAISISTAECERGFSQLNLIMTDVRNSLSVETLSSLLYIRIVGPPFSLFKPEKYIRNWLSRGRHAAIDAAKLSKK